jgi:hypothetical protein
MDGTLRRLFEPLNLRNVPSVVTLKPNGPSHARMHRPGSRVAMNPRVDDLGALTVYRAPTMHRRDRRPAARSAARSTVREDRVGGPANRADPAGTMPVGAAAQGPSPSDGIARMPRLHEHYRSDLGQLVDGSDQRGRIIVEVSRNG